MPLNAENVSVLLYLLALGGLATYIATRNNEEQQPQQQRAPRNKKRRFGIHPINRSRGKQGVYSTLYPQLRQDDKHFMRYTRLSRDQFDRLLREVSPHCRRRNSNREPLSVEHRLLLTLRYLVSGDSMRSLAYQFRIGVSTCTTAINELLPQIWTALKPLYMPEPNREDFERIAHEYETLWNLPHCLGCIDGKHIRIFCPRHSGSDFYNYKNFYSINLMAVCDAKLNFLWVDVGAQGACGDSGVFRNSIFGNRIINGNLPTPPDRTLPGDTTSTPFPYFFAADAAFPLRGNLMKPFTKNSLTSLARKVFNYRLSRARLTIENTFGLLASRFRIFHKVIDVKSIEHADNIVLASVVLHNFIMQTKNLAGHNDGIDAREGQGAFEDIVGQREGRHSTRESFALREFLVNYLFSPAGSVPWQVDHVTRGRAQEQ